MGSEDRRGPHGRGPRRILDGLARHGDALAVPLTIILGKGLAFLFQALLGAWYGAGKISDAFIMAHSIPVLLFDGISAALIVCYIPIHSSLKYGRPERLERFDSGLIGISFLLSCAITAFCALFGAQIDRIYASGFDASSLAHMDRYTSILVWSIPFTGAYCILRGHLQTAGKKALSTLGQPIQYAVLILALLLLYPDDEALAWAVLWGNALCLVVFYTAARRFGLRYRPCLALGDPEIRTVGRMIVPVLLSTLAGDLTAFVDRSFASHHGDGVITAMTYGNQSGFAIQGIVSSTLLILVFPRLADLAARSDLRSFADTFSRCADGIVWIAAPLVAGGAILALPIADLLYGHGSFDQESVARTALVLTGYMPGVLCMCLKHVMDRSCYALKRTDYAMRTAFLMTGVNVVLDIALDRVWGYLGLVAATDIAILAGTVMELLLIRREVPELSLRTFLRGLTPPLASSGIMALAVLAVWDAIGRWDLLPTASVWSLAVCVAFGGIVYCALALLLFRDRLKDDLMVFLDQDPR